MTALKRDLTDRAIRALKPAERCKRYIQPDAQVAGFGVRVTDKGHKTFVLVARYGGAAQPAPRAIGDFPTVDLAEARRIAREWREDLRKGVATLGTKPRPPDARLTSPKGRLSASRRIPSGRRSTRSSKNTYRRSAPARSSPPPSKTTSCPCWAIGRSRRSGAPRAMSCCAQ